MVSPILEVFSKKTVCTEFYIVDKLPLPNYSVRLINLIWTTSCGLIGMWRLSQIFCS